MDNTNLPDTVNPVPHASQLMDRMPVPGGAPPACTVQPPSSTDATCQLATQHSQSAVTPLSNSPLPASAPLPVDKSTFSILTKDIKPLYDYFLAENAKGNFISLQQDFSSRLPFDFGFSNLNAAQEIAPGFYVVGAISGLGKTTFLLQLANQIAFQGQPVMYFSREMNKFELLCKTLSYLINKEADHNAMYRRYTAIEIRKGLADGTHELSEQLDYYAQHGKANMAIFKIDASASIETILSFVESFIKRTQKKPVVIIDYLQILGSSTIVLPDGKSRLLTDDRENVKHIVDTIKSFQTKHNLMIIGISSLNRMNYTSPISFESFKETGTIEFTADVVWGLQYSVVLEERFHKEQKGNGKYGEVPERKKYELLAEAASAPIREINLSALKNRFGKANYSLFFNYNPKYDTFTPIINNNTFTTDEDSDGLDSLTVDDTKEESA